MSAASPELESLPPDERGWLLQTARLALVRAAAGADPPKLRPPSLPLLEHRACFVTLTRHSRLRGCNGNVYPCTPLYEAVAQNARWAAVRDPRFRPVQPAEVAEIRIEISVLSELTALNCGSADELLAWLVPFRHGVVLEQAGHSATLLPLVWAQLPDKTKFLEYLCRKGGCDPSAWRSRDALISVFEAESFQEPEV